MNSLKEGENILIINAGLIKFGEYIENPYSIHELPFFLFLGVLGGLLGAFFIFINYNVNKLRKKYLKTNWAKFAEVMALVFLTVSCFYFVPGITNNCIFYDDTEKGKLEKI